MIGAGDFASMHEGLEETIDALADIAKPDDPRARQQRDRGRPPRGRRLRRTGSPPPSCTAAASRSRAIDFYGLGAGIPITPWDWSYDLDDEAATEKLADCPDGAVLVLHSPP